MKYAVLARCPVIGGKVASFDDKESKKISGVGYVGKISDAAVAVVADSVWSALEGRRSAECAMGRGSEQGSKLGCDLRVVEEVCFQQSCDSLLHRRRFKRVGTPHRSGISTSPDGSRCDGARQLHGALPRIEL